jgi:hypothetical protein
MESGCVSTLTHPARSVFVGLAFGNADVGVRREPVRRDGRRALVRWNADFHGGFR